MRVLHRLPSQATPGVAEPLGTAATADITCWTPSGAAVRGCGSTAFGHCGRPGRPNGALVRLRRPRIGSVAGTSRPVTRRP